MSSPLRLAGTITALNVAVGDNAIVGTSVATLSDVTGWYVSAYVDEVDILNVKNGEDASMTMDQYSGKTFAGTVSYVSHSLGTTSNSVSAYPIRDPDDRISVDTGGWNVS